MSAEDEVRQASDRFYAALNSMVNGDTGPLGDIWSHSDTVTTMHPLGGRENGWDEVWGAWKGVAELASDGQVGLDDQLIQAAGDMAYEVGTERGAFTLAGNQVSIEQRVTNIYRREGGAWKIVHHHTDLSEGMIDILRQLQGGG